MATSGIIIDRTVLTNFEKIVNDPTFAKEKKKITDQIPSYQLPFFVVAMAVIGIASTIIKKRLGDRAAVATGIAGLALYGLSAVIIKTNRNRKADQSLQRLIQPIFTQVFHALQTETHYKQQFMLKAFKKASTSIQDQTLNDLIVSFGNFYDYGTGLEDLNNEMFKHGLLETKSKKKKRKEVTNIDQVPTISMENYRKLRPIADKFLQKKLQTNSPKFLQQNLIDLRDRCALLLHSQHYSDAIPYSKSTLSFYHGKNNTLIIQPWDIVDLPQ